MPCYYLSKYPNRIGELGDDWAVLTVWQMPEYFISTRTSLPLTSSSTIGVSLKSSPGLWTTNASVSILVKDMLNHSAKLKGTAFLDVRE